jgi:mono/diheme cytochrome c family protein
MTGFMMWNPITTAIYLPGEAIPAAKAAHGGEAILAVLAIIIWHMYHVHVKRFNKSMFTGKITRQEMEEEHPAELEVLGTDAGWQRPAPELIRRRQRTFIPVAVVIALVLSWGVIQFVTIEPSTAITTVPKGETVAVFAPITPTPRPTTTPRPTAEVVAGASSNSWDGNYSALFSNRCGTCHGSTAVSGLNLSTYLNALKGGSSGPAIVPGNPDASMLVQVQSAGGHPGQLTIDELNQVIQWILAGAPEK